MSVMADISRIWRVEERKLGFFKVWELYESSSRWVAKIGQSIEKKGGIMMMDEKKKTRGPTLPGYNACQLLYTSFISVVLSNISAEA
jgi:hypothetical protein